ncbi:autotransporter assembly complex protein TamA [Chitinimonas arctica]|uniref:autotransporter assembly complex protein TamA n=1 Tax=Chitinimonas arctica TaxID=2594795 RepID=UPI0015D25CD2|nr:autotransporter assembly complex family protein [Chitinimonas arctica]
MPRPSFTPRLLALLMAAPAFAAGLDYHVDINAPAPLAELLRHNLGILRWKGNDYIDREQLERLYEATPKEIETLLAPQGYFQPKIESSIKLERKGWQLQFTVEPGEQAMVHDVDVRVEGAIVNEPDFRARWAELLEVWPLPIGGNFTQSEWSGAKRRGLQALIIDRFPAATISQSRAEIDPAKASAELTVNYDSGPRFTFGELQVKGLQKYPRTLIERFSTFKAGEGYSQQKLLDFQTALQNTPYFSSVFVDVPIDASKPDGVPVSLELVEAPRYKTEVGLGFDTDKGPRASVVYRDSNLRRRGWIGTVDLKLQRREQSFNAGVEFPPNSDGYRYAGNFVLKHEDVSGVNTTTQTVKVQRSRQKGKIEITQALQYTMGHEKTEDKPEQRNKALILSQDWSRISVDNPADPRRGLLLNWQLGGAAKTLFSSTNFVRAWGRVGWYHPLGEDGLLLLRGEAGQVVSDDTAAVPNDWLFRAGGAGSVRGYDYQTLGLKTASGAVEGGRVLATASAEYQHKIVGKWRAAVFADVGGAANDWLSFKAHKGYGVGARWASPVGPFALDVAYGATDKKVRVHFSLGVGF